MIFDTHAHYDDDAFDEDRDAVLNLAFNSGISNIVNVCSTLESLRTTLALADRYPQMYAAAGIHPEELAPLNEDNFYLVREACRHPKVVAVGEIGLDYYWDASERSVQKKWFVRQLDLAREIKKPVIVHSRDAAKDTLDTMKAAHAEDIGGVIHCFSYTREMAREYLNMGYYIGIGGVVTFKNAKAIKEVVDYTPLDRIVLETDCPYLAPVPNRGKRNSSLNLPYVADAIAEIKGITAEEVIAQTEKNAHALYRF